MDARVDQMSNAMFERVDGLDSDMSEVEANNRVWIIALEELLKVASTKRVLADPILVPGASELQKQLFKRWLSRRDNKQLE